LTVPQSGGAPSFNLAGATGLLTLEQVDLNLAVNGNVTIAAIGGRVILREGAKLTLNNGEGGVPTKRTIITGTGNLERTLSGGFVGLTAPTATTTQPVWSVTHENPAAAEVSIVATAATVVLSKSSTSFTL
jgi:hypothetical protein